MGYQSILNRSVLLNNIFELFLSHTEQGHILESSMSRVSRDDDIFAIELHEVVAEKTPDTNHEQQEKQTDLNPLEASKTNITHCHIEREHGIDKKARRKLIIASCLCLVFMIVEVVGGVLSNSIAIATDAAHLLTDLASFMISLFSIWLASRPSTKRMSFGWHRAEVKFPIFLS